MWTFALAHPFLFAILFYCVLATIENVLIAFVNRNKPDAICADCEDDIDTDAKAD